MIGRRLKTFSIGCLAVGLMLLTATSALAIPLSDWISNNPVQDQDKIYTYVSHVGVPLTTDVSFVTIPNPGAIEDHFVTFGPLTATAGTTWSITYDVAIDLVAEPDRFLRKVAFDTNDPNVVADSSKGIFTLGGTPIATLLPSESVNLTQTALRITDTWQFNANGTIISTTNSFIQGIPEPSTFALVGLVGVVAGGVGFARRRRKAKSA